jgi:hypothetical protein
LGYVSNKAFKTLQIIGIAISALQLLILLGKGFTIYNILLTILYNLISVLNLAAFTFRSFGTLQGNVSAIIGACIGIVSFFRNACTEKGIVYKSLTSKLCYSEESQTWESVIWRSCSLILLVIVEVLLALVVCGLALVSAVFRADQLAYYVGAYDGWQDFRGEGFYLNPPPGINATFTHTISGRDGMNGRVEEYCNFVSSEGFNQTTCYWFLED